MSYDIYLAQRLPEQDWEEALNAASERTDETPLLDPSRLDQWRRIVAAVSPLLSGAAHVHTGANEGELSDEVTGLQVELRSHEACVRYPYWEQNDREALHHLVRTVVAVVARETGWSPYDPQADGAFDGELHDAKGLDLIRQLNSGRTADVPPAARWAVLPGTRLRCWTGLVQRTRARLGQRRD